MLLLGKMWLVYKCPGAFPLDVLGFGVYIVLKKGGGNQWLLDPLEDTEISGEKQCRCPLLMLNRRDFCRAVLT